MEAAPFVYDAGRRFHGEQHAPYLLPNDVDEADRMDTLHYMLRFMLSGNYAASIDHPRRMLDVGAGTGTWALEMAAEYPQCEITGIDISNIQPQAVLPRNVQFEIMNVLHGMAYNDNRFDYVHMRFISSGIPATYWATLIEDLARVCAAGGVVEIIDTSAMLRNAGPLGQKVNEWFREAGVHRKVNMDMVWEIPALMQAAGLRLERVHYLELPIGEWASKVGMLGWSNLRNLLVSLRHRLMRICNLVDEDMDRVLTGLHEELIAHRSYWKVGIFIGRKP
ncbi:S-adenosyl-L-methionine-dependent methyltransferase [Syncephalis pseudoplumigaleata]|uniref:S-adenosyl-L-methionine-dependent methyltransferase n=1 Tax=Syncephalis pseudoplumigaleata TaxID=1712513 RepID=A0A4P9Z283_9FUNG|nr:S-adenosyl-L-methionine-dependent methyltransferase [Syncephalis pseudoplumigaleata]|eukprot:RKP25881.1 S-adenosyl-L-methionine-dependent methyltransferase [Syncephalis pseudoplumigaleata]